MTSTQRSLEIRPPTTPPSWSRSTRSSTPGSPLGILRKSPRPSSFCPSKSNGQWSVETTCKSSLTRPFHRSSQWSFVRSGGEQTYFAPSNPLPRSSSDRKRYCGQVSAKAAVQRVANRLERLPGRQVDDVDRDLGRLGEADDAVGRLSLENGLAGKPMADRVGRPGGHGLLRDDVDGHPVLGVHHDQTAILLGLLHRPEDR